MAHPLYAVGLQGQAPLLLVLADAGVSPSMGRLRYWELVGNLSGVNPSSAKRPVWSRAITAGAGYSTLTPEPLGSIGVPSSFEGRYAYGVDPDIGVSVADYPLDRDGICQRVHFPEKSGLVFGDFCHLGVQADATGDWTWDVNVHFEEL